MKPFREVEETRRQYHAEPTANSVHRSSLLVPELPGAVAEISFLNHFRLKRGYQHVALKITGVDVSGRQIQSRLFPIREPRVHTFRLTGMFERPAAAYVVEFYAAENLFIPFPAVMINHHGAGFFNSVHAYNRGLNDVFEDDAINAHPRPEASIDVRIEDDVDTFVVFTAGPRGCPVADAATLAVELTTPARTFQATRTLTTPRFCSTTLGLKELFPDLPCGATGVLRIHQPTQFLFYGRMLVGTRSGDGAFSANHSYYDCSGFEEYWPEPGRSTRTYPFFKDLSNRVRMYPIMSPSELALAVEIRDEAGAPLATLNAGRVVSPGVHPIDVEIGALAREAGVDVDRIGSFVVIADTLDGRMPTRVNHQLVYGSGRLEASINVSLTNSNVFVPPNKSGFTWGQVPAGRDLSSRFGIVANTLNGDAADVDVTIYGEQGMVVEFRKRLPSGGAIQCDPDDLGLTRPDSGDPEYLWVVARSSRPDISLFTATRHRTTGHCAGDHGF
jgi:hypothetical protein